MRITVNWPTVEFGLIVLCLAAVGAVAYYFVQTRRIEAEERRQARAFTQDMEAVPMPPWDGATYDLDGNVPEWDPESLAYLADDYVPAHAKAPTLPQPVPPSPVSGPLPVTMTGPLPVLHGTPERDEFMDKLRADNTAFLATLDKL